MSAPPRVVVVGAGIGGLAAALRLRTLSEERAVPLEIVVLEASDRPGGVVGSELCDGVLLERGPDTLVTHKPAGVALCRRLGLGGGLQSPPAGRTDILRDGRLVPVPPGFALLAPTRRRALLASPLLGWRAKLRALAEPLVPPGGPPEGGDESVASFVRRRFGGELFDRIVEPIVGAIYMADAERLSLAATFPRFAALERTRGSVTRGLRGALAPRSAAAEARAPSPAVVALAGGLGQLVDALVGRLPAGALRLRSRVERLARDGGGFSLELAEGRSLAAAAAIVATPGGAAAPILHDLDPALAGEVGEIGWASCATVNLAWPRRTVARPPRALGFFAPRAAGLPLVAAGFVHVKFPERVPDDRVVARLFLGGALRPEVGSLADAALVEIAVRGLTPLLGLDGPPCSVRVFRHPHAMPQLAVGHLSLVARLRERLAGQPGLELAGGPVGAYGVPDSIAAGESAAERLFDWVASRVSNAA